MDGLGTISWEEFVACAEDLARFSAEIADHWELLGDKSIPGEAYLKRVEKTYVPLDYPIDNDEDNADYASYEDWHKEVSACIDPYEAPGPQQRPLILEHHVLWSMSYGVPVIYFNGWRSEYPGENGVSVEVAQRLAESGGLGYRELSQAIHPLLSRTYLHLHPCGTANLLKAVSKSANKLVSWLSCVAPTALNLRLRPEYLDLALGKRDEGAEKKDEEKVKKDVKNGQTES